MDPIRVNINLDNLVSSDNGYSISLSKYKIDGNVFIINIDGFTDRQLLLSWSFNLETSELLLLDTQACRITDHSDLCLEFYSVSCNRDLKIDSLIGE